MAKLFFASSLVLALASCGGAPPVVANAELVMHVTPETASIFVDDHFALSARVAAARPMSFRPGVRHITVTADGYFPHDVEVNLPSGTTNIRLSLRPIPP